jgi:hypothetical protein
MKKAVFGMARSENQAINIANQLVASGFAENDISVLFPDKAGTRDFAHEQHTKAPREQLQVPAAARYWAGRWVGW